MTLRSLACDGLVDRRVLDTVPPSVYYRLTELGVSLEQSLAALRDWAETRTPEVDDYIAVYDARAVDGPAPVRAEGP